MNTRSTTFFTSMFVLAATILITSCGGGGSGAGTDTGGSSGATTGGSTGGTTGIIDPAPDPVCNPTQTRETTRSSQGALDQPGIIVPETTRERPEDLGRVAHTNHLIKQLSTNRAGSPQGLTPAQLRKVYNIPADAGSGAIAIIVAYHYPTALNDFNIFSTVFDLPKETSVDPRANTNSALQVVYSSGTQPGVNTGWAQEAALDIQWAHAVAPNAKIYLVEADTALLSDLMEAVGVAKNLPGVRQISMSFGATEFACGFVGYDPVLTEPGVTFFAPTGDTSNERDFPGMSKNVVSVGGTSLTLNGQGGRENEVVWKSTGGGVSQFEPRPHFQDTVVSFMGAYRGAADISAVGDPNTGVSVYTSTPSQGASGWLVIGGTSAGTPIIAAMANASGNIRSSSYELNQRIYSLIGTGSFYDVVVGRSGNLNAGTGYDLATGAGVPNGLGAF